MKTPKIDDSGLCALLRAALILFHVLVRSLVDEGRAAVASGAMQQLVSGPNATALES
jgi:hypothetical protein